MESVCRDFLGEKSVRSERFPYPVSVELLNSRQCRGISGELNQFENSMFGPDFACSLDSVQPWFRSSNLFYSAICGEAVPGRKVVLAVASILLTTMGSRERLVRGEMMDFELTPWSLSRDGTEPTLYLSSIVSSHRDHLTAMYEGLFLELLAYRLRNDLVVRTGFSIATGAAGLKHMAKSGFEAMGGHKYLGKYPLMQIDSTTAKSRFWKSVLGPGIKQRDKVLASGELVQPGPI